MIDDMVTENASLSGEAVIAAPAASADTAVAVKKKHKMGMKAKRAISDTIIYIILITLCVLWLVPFVWLLAHSFRPSDGNAFPTQFFPTAFTFENYIILFTSTQYPFWRWFLNTLLVSVCTCVISTLLVLMVSFALSRLRFKARKKLMNIALILGLFPGFMSMIALYYMFKQFGLTDSLFGLILAYSLASGSGYYIVKGFFDTIPTAIDEAARIDGATRNRIFWQMIIPLSQPIIIYTIITTFLGPWYDYIMVSVFMRDNIDNFTVSLGLYRWLERELIGDWFVRFCAGSVVVSIPIATLFIILQRFYVEGITGGAAKG